MGTLRCEPSRGSRAHASRAGTARPSAPQSDCPGVASRPPSGPAVTSRRGQSGHYGTKARGAVYVWRERRDPRCEIRSSHNTRQMAGCRVTNIYNTP